VVRLIFDTFRRLGTLNGVPVAHLDQLYRVAETIRQHECRLLESAGHPLHPSLGHGAGSARIT
jgi:hypothetical protein